MNTSHGIVTVLSSPLLLEDGQFQRFTITLDEAKRLVESAEEVHNFSGHQTVKLLDLNPAEARKNCLGFETALVLQPKGRLEFGREYTIEEILEVGVTPVVIRKS